MSSEIARQFGINLGRARRRTGLSQEALAVLASLHRTEVGLLERGERCPRIDTAVKLAAALEVSVNDLVAGIAWNPGAVHPGGFGIAPSPDQGGAA